MHKSDWKVALIAFQVLVLGSISKAASVLGSCFNVPIFSFDDVILGVKPYNKACVAPC